MTREHMNMLSLSANFLWVSYANDAPRQIRRRVDAFKQCVYTCHTLYMSKRDNFSTLSPTIRSRINHKMHILFAMLGSGSFVTKKISSNGNVTSEIYGMHSLIRTWDNNEILSTSKFVIDADRLVKLQLQPQLEHILRLIAVHMLTYHNQELLISEMLSWG